MKALRLAINIILAIGCFAVFNEGESLVPNFVGLCCFIALLAINPHGVDWLTESEKK